MSQRTDYCTYGKEEKSDKEQRFAAKYVGERSKGRLEDGG